MLGSSPLIGEFNRNGARLRPSLQFVATIAKLIHSVLAEPDAAFALALSLGISVVLITVYVLESEPIADVPAPGSYSLGPILRGNYPTARSGIMIASAGLWRLVL